MGPDSKQSGGDLQTAIFSPEALRHIAVYEPEVSTTVGRAPQKWRIGRPKRDLIPLAYIHLIFVTFAIQASLVQEEIQKQELPDDLLIKGQQWAEN